MPKTVKGGEKEEEEVEKEEILENGEQIKGDERDNSRVFLIG